MCLSVKRSHGINWSSKVNDERKGERERPIRLDGNWSRQGSLECSM